MRFDLHIHSNHSPDCSMTVDDILKQAVKNGLDGIAICDHDTVEGSLLGIRRCRELSLPLLVLPGMEVSAAEGHLLVLGIRENISPGLSYHETIKISRQKGGVVIAAHPFKIGGIGSGAQYADTVETFNSRCVFGENVKAKKMAQKYRKPEVGGSDAHMLSTIGLAFTDIDTKPDEASVLSAIREGRTSSSGRITPLHLVLIQSVYGRLARVTRPGKVLYSKIFHKKKPM